jgi:hypothetical protein
MRFSPAMSQCRIADWDRSRRGNAPTSCCKEHRRQGRFGVGPKSCARRARTPYTAVLECDRVQLQQVLLNLVRNGLEAMGAVTGRPRVLRISATPNAASEALIAVQDSGVELGAETADRIFEPLFTTKLDGMGTALSIAVDRRGPSWAPLGLAERAEWYDLSIHRSEAPSRSVGSNRSSTPLTGGSRRAILRSASPACRDHRAFERRRRSAPRGLRPEDCRRRQ